MIAIEYIVS